MQSKFRLFLLITLIFVCGYGLGLASQEAYQVSVNGNPSQIEVQRDKDTLLVPLTVPLDGDAAEWSVSLVRDDKAHKVEVKMTQPKVKLRGMTDCYYCNGEGQCLNDYPAGSGRTCSGVSEGMCNGTGRCYHCSGTGKL